MLWSTHRNISLLSKMLDQLISLKFAHLSVECKDDKVCLQRDPNSHCLTLDERTQCVCKSDYHLDITNRTAKCVYGESPEEFQEGLSAAPIILCFMGCVIVEAVCLLVFHYWKKRRRTSFISHGTCHLPPVSLADVRFHIRERGPVISFRITPDMESNISDTRNSSPPPYSQTGISSNVSQNEEPPPPYDEAVKQCTLAPVKPCVDKNNRRKMSC